MRTHSRSVGTTRLSIGTAEQFRWLQVIVVSLLVLNLLDGLFTLAWVRAGLAVEANALMRDLAHGSAPGFLLAKVSLVSLGSVVLWRQRTRALAVIAIFLAFLAYYLVLLQHLEFSSRLLFGSA